MQLEYDCTIPLPRISPQNHQVMNYDYINPGPLCSGVSTGVRCNLPRSQGYQSCFPWLKQNFRNTPLRCKDLKVNILLNISALFQKSHNEILSPGQHSHWHEIQTQKKCRANAGPLLFPEMRIGKIIISLGKLLSGSALLYCVAGNTNWCWFGFSLTNKTRKYCWGTFCWQLALEFPMAPELAESENCNCCSINLARCSPELKSTEADRSPYFNTFGKISSVSSLKPTKVHNKIFTYYTWSRV